MKRLRLIGAVAGSLLCVASQGLNAAAGYATRELNPMLQPLFLPSLVPVSAENGWRIDHSFFLTNTFQQRDQGNESLIIDVENYRYELDLSHRRDKWLTQVNIPLMANRGGELDGTIENWHDFFGFPQGERDQYPQDQIDIEYQRDGVVEYSQTEASEGLGDIAISIGYQPADATAYFVGIELPTGSEKDFTGNEAIDIAFWLTREAHINADINAYGMLGISFPGDDGNLEGLTADHIWVAQLGVDYRFYDNFIATAQLDMHTSAIQGSALRAFEESYQILLGLGFLRLFENHRLDLFFTEDILVRSAPDITFGLRLAREF
ncbi:MAG: DUF3187 family protein [Gammaproteobacteria bacterium]|nr:DUF3187 family protein [Gammaproteobacteria bacterium]